ncbi:hypothetical protein [Nakamurella sp. PAMC28650]|uniref:hypothetical protein n=1 Tax=Nakamurella sp. PAMC28650 TaxID=2762325 RepID=UPI00164EB932|nr:hypothetical protein [Nakamurella sp. PAMC28650]QNK82789.1 hypothetical protein H7F38_08990 [Nakamurella sp. PAMC28650]
MFRTETPSVGCTPGAKLGAPVLATSASDASGHSSRPCASVVGAGGDALVGFGGVVEVAAFVGAVELAVVLGGVVFAGPALAGGVVAAVVFAAVVFAAVVFAAVVWAAEVLAGIVVGLLDGAEVFVTVALIGFDELESAELLGGTDADNTGGDAERDASTPVRVGAEDPLATTAAPDRLAAVRFVFWMTRKPTPISTMTAATITLTRRSQ